ncbi:helix-turn-helix domain-containing protein [Streptomyces atratus]
MARSGPCLVSSLQQLRTRPPSPVHSPRTRGPAAVVMAAVATGRQRRPVAGRAEHRWHDGGGDGGLKPVSPLCEVTGGLPAPPRWVRPSSENSSGTGQGEGMCDRSSRYARSSRNIRRKWEPRVTNELGTLLRQLRRRARLTQEQLAERSQVSVSTIRRLETGKSTDHRLRTLHLLAEALEVEAEERQRLTAILDGAQPGPAGRREEPVPTAPLPVAPAEPPAGAIADAAASLAREVRRRWQCEEKHRRVHDPFPLPVRHQPAPVDLMDRPENIQRLQPGAVPRDLDLSGELRSVVGTYRSVESQRLVILGRAGSGKSVLAIKFVLDLLAAPVSSVQVPVIFSIGSWDPTTTTLRDILVNHLLRDHPHLAHRTSDRTTLAAALVDADLVLPVLDGLDELAEALRGPALEALNATSLPLVLTSRRDEYAQAVREVHAPLVWAACIELTDLTVEDLAAYLPRTDRLAASPGGQGDAGLWDAVLERLRVHDTPASVRPDWPSGSSRRSKPPWTSPPRLRRSGCCPSTVLRRSGSSSCSFRQSLSDAPLAGTSWSACSSRFCPGQ